jgi:hypothetical protein
MEFRKKSAHMTLCDNFLFQKGHLQLEVILLTEKMCHIAVIVLKRTNWRALHYYLTNLKPTFLQDLFKALCLTCVGCHFLKHLTELSIGIVDCNYSIFSFFIVSPH